MPGELVDQGVDDATRDAAFDFIRTSFSGHGLSAWRTPAGRLVVAFTDARGLPASRYLTDGQVERRARRQARAAHLQAALDSVRDRKPTDAEADLLGFDLTTAVLGTAESMEDRP